MEIYNIKIPIDDPEKIVFRLGGILLIDDTLPIWFYPVIKKNLDVSEFTLVISKYETIEEKLRKIIMGIGHLFLHMGYKINDELWNSYTKEYKTSGYTEFIEAEEFLYDFVMPLNLFKTIVYENTDRHSLEVDIKKVADFFNVPTSWVLIRGKRLHMIE